MYFSVDQLLDGGLYSGEVTEIVGAAGVGKSQVSCYNLFVYLTIYFLESWWIVVLGINIKIEAEHKSTSPGNFAPPSGGCVILKLTLLMFCSDLYEYCCLCCHGNQKKCPIHWYWWLLQCNAAQGSAPWKRQQFEWGGKVKNWSWAKTPCQLYKNGGSFNRLNFVKFWLCSTVDPNKWKSMSIVKTVQNHKYL